MLTIILQIVACLLGVYQSRTENKRNIYITVFLFNLSCLIVYAVIGEWATVYSYILITVRSFTYIHKDKFKTPIVPIMFILVHLIVGVFTMTSYWQILPMIAPMFTCYYMWFMKNTQGLRIGNAVAATIWLVYNLHCGLYVLCINRVVTIVSNVIAYIQKRNNTNK